MAGGNVTVSTKATHTHMSARAPAAWALGHAGLHALVCARKRQRTLLALALGVCIGKLN